MYSRQNGKFDFCLQSARDKKSDNVMPRTLVGPPDHGALRGVLYKCAVLVWLMLRYMWRKIRDIYVNEQHVFMFAPKMIRCTCYRLIRQLVQVQVRSRRSTLEYGKLGAVIIQQVSQLSATVYFRYLYLLQKSSRFSIMRDLSSPRRKRDMTDFDA